MEFAKVCKGNLIFNKFIISLVREAVETLNYLRQVRTFQLCSKIVDKTER